MPQIAIAWVLSRTAVSSVLLGCRTLNQIKDNLKASEIELNKAEIEELNKVGEIPDIYPYSFIKWAYRLFPDIYNTTK